MRIREASVVATQEGGDKGTEKTKEMWRTEMCVAEQETHE